MTTCSWIAASLRAHWGTRGSARHQRGEGVISAAIVVLIMALLGASMWIAFNKVWSDTSQKTSDNVKTIGAPSP